MISLVFLFLGKIKDSSEDQNQADGNESPQKKVKLKGRNKQRPVNKRIQAEDKLCPSVLHQRVCSFGEKCKFSHDIKQFMEKKPADIGPECHNFLTFGKCHYGLACRFGKMHISDESKNIVNTELFEKVCKDKITLNVLEKELQVKLWKKKYDFSKANDNVCQIKKWCQEKTQERVASQSTNTLDAETNGCSASSSQGSTNVVVCETGEGPIMLRNQEKKIVRKPGFST